MDDRRRSARGRTEVVFDHQEEKRKAVALLTRSERHGVVLHMPFRTLKFMLRKPLLFR